MELPAQFGRYELQEFLGGGMSHVYRARDTVLNRTVAVKILTESATADPDAKARFLREARTAGNVHHDNIINIYDFGEYEGRPYMVMEFLRGQDLRQAIQNQQTGDLYNRLAIALGLARALEHIHSLGIVHRDIKPENVHIDQSGRVKLMDFGIAKSMDLNLTRPGFTLGTPSYMAPEQVRGQEVTPLVDVYAFGIMLFELLTGLKAIQAKAVAEIFQKILNDPLDMAPLQATGAGPAVLNLVWRCTAKNPAERPQSLQAVRQDLEGILVSMEGGVIPDQQAAPAPHAVRPVWLLPAAGAVVVLLILIGFFALRPKARPEPKGNEGPPAGMILIQGGPFLYGPQGQKVDLLSFYIDRTEVSVADYSRFSKANNRPAPAGAPNLPVTGITIDEARAFAQWAGKRLPTLQEWEKAARGSDGRLYPWGASHDPKSDVVADNPDLKPRAALPVDSLPASASPYGVLHMAGNVREYVMEFGVPGPDVVRRFATLLSPAPTAAESWCVVRGGAYDEALPKNVNLVSMLVPVRYRGAGIGFRCARDSR